LNVAARLKKTRAKNRYDLFGDLYNARKLITKPDVIRIVFPLSIENKVILEKNSTARIHNLYLLSLHNEESEINNIDKEINVYMRTDIEVIPGTIVEYESKDENGYNIMYTSGR
jgi:hypothetical protein